MELGTIFLPILFFILMIVNMLSCRRMLKGVIYSAGVDIDEANEFFQRHSHSRFQQGDTYRWLYHKATDKKRFRQLYRLYVLCTLPSPICILLALVTLFVQGINTQLKIIAVVMTMLVILIAIMVNLKSRKNK